MSLVQLHLNAPSWPMSPKKLAVKPELGIAPIDSALIGTCATLGVVPGASTITNALVGAVAGSCLAKQNCPAKLVPYLDGKVGTIVGFLGGVVGGVTGFAVGAVATTLSLDVPPAMLLSATFAGMAARVLAEVAVDQRQEVLDRRYEDAQQLVSESGPIRDMHFGNENFQVQTAHGEWICFHPLLHNSKMELDNGTLVIDETPKNPDQPAIRQRVWSNGTMEVTVTDKDSRLWAVADKAGTLEGAAVSNSQSTPQAVLAEWTEDGQLLVCGQQYQLPIHPVLLYKQPKTSPTSSPNSCRN